MKILAAKKSMFAGTNTVNIPSRAQVIEADTEEESLEVSDKIR